MKESLIDKRTLEVILNDQKEELEGWSENQLCSRGDLRLFASTLWALLAGLSQYFFSGPFTCLFAGNF